ncbi:MAG: hypothetical protein AAGI71_11710 [Bacteroidota bacterium]
MSIQYPVEGPRTVVHTAPAQFVPHVFQHTVLVPRPQEQVWTWLNDPRTFTDSQLWPWRIEFVAPAQGAPSGFHPGTLTTHHGPLMNFAGRIGAVEPPTYRDLQYVYGSYFLSLRLIRPTRLQFWLEPDRPGRTRVHLRLDSYVRPWLAQPWSWAQGVFWSRFGRWVGQDTV